MHIFASKSSLPFDPPSILRLWLRRVRNVFFIVIALMIAIEFYGIPYLRWNYRYQGSYKNPIYLDAEYVSPVGWRGIRAGEYAESCPLILWLQPEKPIYRYAIEATKDIFN